MASRNKLLQSDPVISVIVPVHNAADVLERALSSIVQQSYPHLEIIIFDGGSTDGSLEIIDRYSEHLTHWRSQPDQGIYDAMNQAAALAAGDFILFQGADDILVNCLHKVVRHIRRRDHVYYGDVYMPRKNKVYDGEFSVSKLANKNICHQAIFYPRNVFAHYQFDLRYRILADWDLNIKLWADKRYKLKYIPVLITIYNDSGLSADAIDEPFQQDKAHLIAAHLARDLKRQERYFNLQRSLSKILDSLRLKIIVKRIFRRTY